ncbi:MAG: DNA repair protein RadA [Candidatus Magasanikbacteria bacterium RIFCSPLOWO2_01_FULL_43_20b]|uniref:DNA repair protein RadA n=1 Tax=Candidatus Magasanikbacteria bacterium RIFCSPLOWO2_12_FULL_43_12 TaxID=1798692 RepID=A0A1F6MV85_9BACT|nr:MAG: DNA repair protein RadA [Candidatus Magasanikbacteria bacterium RIFCSPHIGHO2_02_FULL_44_13]OGH72628.1 MAG: DNA repair protein RadA [Candidatus Magasanikbacteria bacterium RIFCSPLOWO2_02_FULL_43_22]OGH73598.1 MAG: DNA repair protein RadA [Candidatus Magasanikbacteria bacterium RIFCSPLOWO2_01_FULL_43_20b]OGH75564.1 MAG: DNA repair protein RadA [Candidatus Magasanikbacteria bacterium RIFCSPLOWO2_12_FULL_43_12]
MVDKNNTIFVCTNCGAQYSKWIGRCLECGKWGTIEQNTKHIEQNTKENTCAPAKTVKLSEIKGENVRRQQTDLAEFDRVLGGGIVPGSLILLGGEPGIGKSTLAIQLAAIIPNTLYISGEESVGQIKLRTDRLRLSAVGLQLANETNVGIIRATVDQTKPTLAIIDSIQTIYSDDVQGEPGSINQIKSCATRLMETAKSTDIAMIIVGHVTKDGEVAGPKTLEHLVDTVLYLEGERYHQYRILRTVKNRFGPTDEVGIFEMKENGLQEVKNPSASFLSERGENMPGSVVTCLLEGTRPLLVEIQALVNKTSFGYPVRKASGFDLNRLHVLTAVLQKRAGLNLAQYDIHLNVVGGITADEPAADLAVCLAIASAYKDKKLGADLAVFGEVGLGGEVRGVTQVEKRVRECEKLGMKRVIANESIKTLKPENIKVIGVKNIQELIRQT